MFCLAKAIFNNVKIPRLMINIISAVNPCKIKVWLMNLFCWQTSSVFDDTNGWDVTPSQSADFTENTFMQVTMDDLDQAEVTNNSFCQPKMEEPETSTCNVYYTSSYRKSQSCTRQPLTRYDILSAVWYFSFKFFPLIFPV